MKRGQETEENEKDLQTILKTRGVKLQRGKRVIDRIIRERSGKIIKNNPEKKYHKEKPTIDSLEHYSQSEFSLETESVKVKSPPPRPLPRRSPVSSASQKQNQQDVYVTEDSILAEKARQFVSRLRKQKQYEWGKYLIRRKKQEEIRQKRQKEMLQSREKQKAIFRLQRYRKMMDSILYHEERVSFRLRSSLNHQKSSSIRCRTEGSEDFEKKMISRSAMFDGEKLKRSSNSRVSELPTLGTLKQRLAALSQMMNSLQQ